MHAGEWNITKLMYYHQKDTMEPIYCGHLWDIIKCPNYWRCPHFRGSYSCSIIVYFMCTWSTRKLSKGICTLSQAFCVCLCGAHLQVSLIQEPVSQQSRHLQRTQLWSFSSGGKLTCPSFLTSPSKTAHH